MSNTEHDTCEFLPWDSEFFGLRIARVRERHLTRHNVQQIMDWCTQAQIDCLYFLAEADDPATIALAQAHRFQLVDIRVTLGLRSKNRPQHPALPQSHVRSATAADVEALKAIARVSHLDSRFFFDPHFDRARSATLYAVWIEKSCQDYADAVLVYDDGGGAAGYITCDLDRDNSGSIGLVGVAAAWQGKGVGSTLVGASIDWLVKSGAAHVSVVTQGRNVRAQRLYQRHGFVTETMQLWYHRWFIDQD
ncbi:MAG: GNAT family N-acetyltransferase [Anaerolineae bacterium]|nr:GNAT family N-acetyltransferase [Anaerolineae bacterium]